MVEVEGSLPSFAVVDERRWVIGLGFPGGLLEFFREFGELGEVLEGIGILRVEAFCLADGVEYAEVGCCIGSASGGPLPAEGVVGEVGVDEILPEPLCALLPGQEEVFGEEGRDDHACAVVHPSGAFELEHGGIDDGVSGLGFLPGLEVLGVPAPGEAVELFAEGFVGGVREVVEELSGEFSPEYLGLKYVQAFCMDFCFGGLKGLPDGAGRDFAVAQMGREAGGGFPGHEVALDWVIIEMGFDEELQRFESAFFAGRPVAL